MKIMSARETKGFGLMIGTARTEPVLIEKHGRGVPVVVSVEEYERLFVQSGRVDKGETGTKGRSNLANEACARVKTDQLLKSADRALADGYSVGFGHPLDGDGKADFVLLDRQGRAFGASGVDGSSVNLTGTDPWRLCAAVQLRLAERRR